MKPITMYATDDNLNFYSNPEAAAKKDHATRIDRYYAELREEMLDNAHISSYENTEVLKVLHYLAESDIFRFAMLLKESYNQIAKDIAQHVG